MRKLLPLLTLFFTAVCCGAEQKLDAGPAPSEAELAAVAGLSELGVQVRPIAAGINWKSAIVRRGNAPADPKIFKLLAQVPTLQELDLAGAEFGEAELAEIGGLEHLRVLHLERTPTTDAMLAHLKGLKNLRYLNLYGTNITDAGLPHLHELTGLRSLYVFETKVTDDGIAGLKRSLPEAQIVKGWTAADVAKLAEGGDEKKQTEAGNKAAEEAVKAAEAKLAALQAEIGARREARGKLTQGTPEYAAANDRVQELKPEIEKAAAAVEAAKAKRKK